MILSSPISGNKNTGVIANSCKHSFNAELFKTSAKNEDPIQRNNENAIPIIKNIKFIFLTIE